jgi:hypothetical protein
MPGTPASDRLVSGKWSPLHRGSLAHEHDEKFELGKRASFEGSAPDQAWLSNDCWISGCDEIRA